MNSLSNRTILVTGAGHGIGRAVSQGLAQAGAAVIILDKDVAALESLYDAIVENGGPEPAIYPMDLVGATAGNYEELGDTLNENFDSLEGILHNAAMLSLISRVDDYDPATWIKVMQVNLNAPFLLTQACLPLLRAADNATVVFTGDETGRKGRAYWGGYAVSKAGSDALMQVLADELENSNIRVNSFDPGPTRTNLRHHAYPGEDPMTVKPAEELVPVYLQLMDPDASIEHGKVLLLADFQDDYLGM